MLQLLLSKPAKHAASLLLGLGLAASVAAAAPNATTPLLLDVSINNSPKNLIGQFLRDAQGRILIEAQELEAIGLRAPQGAKPKDVIALDDIKGLSFRIDDARQAIGFSASPAHLATTKYDASGNQALDQERLKVKRDYGALLNYTIFASGSHDLKSARPTYNGASASLEGRFSAPIGTLSQTAIIGNTLTSGEHATALRLDTTWLYSDQMSAITYRAGDMVSGGMAWTRPVRLGGLQAQRNFNMRPDLVTLPLPSVSGSAAVPSSVDVYVNNIKTFSRDVSTGPFTINNLPVLSGGGQARMVVRDASGREVETKLPFFISSKLLRAGLSDFSIEAGAPRLDYGSKSFSYGSQMVASGSARYGLTDAITLESHAEATRRLVNAGAGINIRTGGLGVATFALAGSHFARASGAQIYAGYDAQMFGLTFSAASQRTIGTYNDIAAVTAPRTGNDPTLAAIAQVTGLTRYFDFGAVRPAKAIDRVSLGLPLGFDSSAINLSFAHIRQADNRVSRIASTSYSKPLPFSASLFVTAFMDVSDRSNKGLFAGLSMPLGADIGLSTGVTRDNKGWGVATQVAKSMKQDVGDYGWRIIDMEGKTQNRSAAASYRSQIAQVEGGIAQSGRGVLGTATIEGAISSAGGDVFLSNRINDGFAVVKAGAPGVKVDVENRYAGTTNSNGKLLVADLRSFQKNKVTIDPSNLPLTASMETTREVVAPADGGVVVVDFGVNTETNSAHVTFQRANGKAIPAGTQGQLNDGTRFVVGYGGKALIQGLSASNHATLTFDGGSCTASFHYAKNKQEQVFIGPVSCQ